MTILVSLYVLIIGLFRTEVHAETSEPTYLRLKVTNPSFFQTMHQQGKPVWCEFMAEGLDICPLKVKGDQIQMMMYTERPEGDWKQMFPPASEVSADRFVQQPIKGTELHYWATGKMDGLDGLGWIYPDALQSMVGTDVLVAQPISGAFFVWSKESMDANKIMAISIKELYSTAKEPVSPYIYHWTKDAWMVWGEAVKKNPTP